MEFHVHPKGCPCGVCNGDGITPVGSATSVEGRQRNDLIFVVEVVVDNSEGERDWRAFVHFSPFFSPGDALTAIEGLPNVKILRVARYLRVGIETTAHPNPVITTVPPPDPAYVANLLRPDYDGKEFQGETMSRSEEQIITQAQTTGRPARTTMPTGEERIAVALEGLLNAFTRAFPSGAEHAARERVIDEARKLAAIKMDWARSDPNKQAFLRVVQAVQEYDNIAGPRVFGGL